MSSWNNLAACRGLDITIFFPDPEAEPEADRAKSVCSECAVQGTCLERAIDRREKNGVWGGCTERERRRIIRRRRRTA
ncbi:MAG: WhiB family transcriptional regulator [Actinomycetia bacterium]|nr:WhiB family transcriptional regulator [Actinomycetes bacterium]